MNGFNSICMLPIMAARSEGEERGMGNYQFGASALLGLGISVGVIALIRWFYLRFKHLHFFAREEMHHTHRMGVPRIGGISLAVAFVGVFLFSSMYSKNHWQLQNIAIFAIAMFGLGLWDDFSPLGAKRKLVGQLLIASAACFSGINIQKFQIPVTLQTIDLGALSSWVVTVFWLVSITNLINLIDGIDGLAGGICLMLMLLLTYAGQQTGTELIAAGMAGALLGFLRFNFPPARVYMGDGGAYFLGFLTACISIFDSQKGTVFAALTAPLFVLALPILDTTFAILRRGLLGLPVFRPDRHHIHHRLLEAGLSRRKVVLGAYCFSSFFLMLGFIAFWWRGQYFALLLGISALAILAMAGRMKFSREWFAVGQVFKNCVEARPEIQYALAHSRWLALEGMRGQSINDLCEDVVFVARKLGYASVRIGLEDGEKVWRLTAEVGEENGNRFRYALPAHHRCFLELCAPPWPEGLDAALRTKKEETLKILSDLVMEGWTNAMHTCNRKYHLQLCFDIQRSAPSALKQLSID